MKRAGNREVDDTGRKRGRGRGMRRGASSTRSADRDASVAERTAAGGVRREARAQSAESTLTARMNSPRPHLLQTPGTNPPPRHFPPICPAGDPAVVKSGRPTSASPPASSGIRSNVRGTTYYSLERVMRPSVLRAH